MTRKRVVVWGTGPIGMPGLRQLIGHPEYELVGLHAWSPDKVGRDAGDIAGLNVRTGVISTNDVAELLALKADCLVYQGNYAEREAQCTADVLPFLEAGTNCVTPALMDLIAPRYGRSEFVDPIEAACKKGGSSIFCGGTDPGRRNITTPLARSLAGGAGLPRLEASRLRMTWLADCARLLGLATFMHAAGITCSQRLGDLLAVLEPADEATAVTLLGARR